MGGPANPDARVLVEEATRVVEAAKEQTIPLRIFGATAIRQHCPDFGHLQDELGRKLGDIDFACYEKYSSRISHLIEGLGYAEDVTVTAFGGGRLIFRKRVDGMHCDVFLGKLQMSHTITFDKRLELDYPTIPLADLLLAKLQIFKLNEKDVIDTIVLLREHKVGEGNSETIDSQYVSLLCSKDWGLWRTVTGNLGKVSALLPNYGTLPAADKEDVASKLTSLLKSIEAEPKSLAWRLRARVGETRKWYVEVEDLYR